jgi:hypothetical protein
VATLGTEEIPGGNWLNAPALANLTMALLPLLLTAYLPGLRQAGPVARLLPGNLGAA